MHARDVIGFKHRHRNRLQRGRPDERSGRIRGLFSASRTRERGMRNAGVSSLQRCADAGMDDFVAKPIDPDELLDLLAEWIGRR